jgi:anti-anti-sigma factor
VAPAEGGTRIELAGELDVATAPELQRRADEVLDADGDVWLDCSALTFADSSGLNTLTRLAMALRAQGRRLVLTDVRPVVRQAMDVLQITDLFELDEREG